MNIAEAHEAQLIAKGSGGAVVALGAIVIALQCHPVAESEAQPVTFRDETPSTDWLSERIAVRSVQGAAKAARIRALFAKWAAEDPTHDQTVWKGMVDDVEENRLSDRRRFG